MKFLASTICFLTCTLLVRAQLPWHNMSDFPGPARDDASGIVCKGYGYMGTGFGTGFVFLNDWWKYDFTSDSWTPRSALPGAPRQYTAIAAIDDHIYLLGGITPAGCSNELWVYHTANDEWTLLTHFPGGGRQAPVLAAVGGKLFAGMGRCGTNYYNDWWELDPVQVTWKELTSFPGTARFDPVQAVVNEEILIGAGLSASGGEQDVYAWHPAYNTWKQLASFPGCGNFYTVQIAYENHLCVVNGADEDYDFCPDAYHYTAGFFSDTWKAWDIAALDPIRRGGVGFGYQNRFYYLCGLDTSGNRLKKVGYIEWEIPQEDKENDWMLYPTIAQDFISIESKSEMTGSISIYNSAGQYVPLNLPAVFSQYARVDVSGLSPGVYLLRLVEETGETVTRKFIRL